MGEKIEVLITPELHRQTCNFLKTHQSIGASDI